MAREMRMSKQATGLLSKTFSFHRASRFLVHFLAVTTPLRRKNAYFHVLNARML